jgi:hypothetical protein
MGADGRYVAFASAASNLIPGDTNEDWDVFLVPVSFETLRRLYLP